MRIFNRKQLASIPMVDAGNLYLGADSATVEARRAKIERDNQLRARAARAAQMRAQAAAKAEEARRIRAAQAHAEMLQRSLQRNNRQVALAGRRQGSGWVPQFGLRNPTLGFVDEVRGPGPNYNQSDVVPAQDFNNHLTNHDSKRYSQFKDFPLVVDAPKGDFGGILTNEAGSADFSERIVNDVRQDFGYVPRRRR